VSKNVKYHRIQTIFASLSTEEELVAAIRCSLRDFGAAMALSVMVLGFSFVVILVARFFTRRAEEHTR
jgi:ABC-type sulfate transport system permease component